MSRAGPRAPPVEVEMDRYFIFRRSYYDVLLQLGESERLELVDAMCAYAFERKVPTFESKSLSVAWPVIRRMIIEDGEE